jgi:hypothetical protein
MTIKSRITKVNKAIDKLNSGQYCDVDIHWICNSIEWLYRYKHIDCKQKDELVDKVLEYFRVNGE